ncbi:MAG: D-alanyl-D-alanine endopeptidase [Neisseriaceae bacterium]|nr:MAG: D-alanyl-D-alanine endopeptidase [Neisseriaceae bacterium]
MGELKNKKLRRLVFSTLILFFSVSIATANDFDDPLKRVIDIKVQSATIKPEGSQPDLIKMTQISQSKTKLNNNNKKVDDLEKIIQTIVDNPRPGSKSVKEVMILTVDNKDEGGFRWGNYLDSSLYSRSAIVINDRTGEVMYQKNPHIQTSLASITKLMAAMVFLDSKQNMSTPITITDEDVDRLKKSGSRLAVGTTLMRQELLHIGLMSSENRAIHALARNYPGGKTAFVSAMNAKARQLGMTNTIFYEPTGLDPRNKSTAYDIVRMAQAADRYPLIRYYTTDQQTQVRAKNGKMLTYRNSNVLVRNGQWNVGLQKTGYIKEAGRCMVVKSKFGDDNVYLVFLGAPSSYSRVSDAEHVREVFGGRYY